MIVDTILKYREMQLSEGETYIFCRCREESAANYFYFIFLKFVLHSKFNF